MQGCSKQAKARAYIALVRPHLETCSPVWTPYQKGIVWRMCRSVQNKIRGGQGTKLFVHWIASVWLFHCLSCCIAKHKRPAGWAIEHVKEKINRYETIE